ncbi:ROK family protein [Nonomuraea angiospora]|uniref:ROK family protein n=1 Tax=Nonomuraea angiospora TaxID=46172 RepID=UPI0029B96C69|nr:ROK family protein [Nonomuraea angiospora]MDX3107195.1 ROK family protein [Nonomuraea angiospora]
MRAVSVAIAATVQIGNDATLAGLAEVRHGTDAGAETVLHVTMEVGVGGTLLVDGRPLHGATGSQ